MAIAYVQSKKSTVAGNPITFDTTPIAGNLVVVVSVQFDDNVGPNAISDNRGNTYTRILESADGVGAGGDNHLAIFYAKNIATGSPFTITSTINDGSTATYEFSGADPTAPLDKWNVSFANSISPSSSVTTTVHNELYFAAMSDGGADGDAYTPGAGYTLGEQNLISSTTERFATEYKIANLGTVAGDFGMPNSNPWVVGMASFKAAGPQSPAATSVLMSGVGV